jgi:hypothetical protein
VRPLATPKASPALMAMWVCAGLTLFLGIFPQPFVRMLNRP